MWVVVKNHGPFVGSLNKRIIGTRLGLGFYLWGEWKRKWKLLYWGYIYPSSPFLCILDIIGAVL